MAYANDEERTLVEQMIFLPLVKKVLVHDAQALATYTKLPRPYLKLNESIFRTVSNDLRIVKREVYKRGMKVFEDSRDHTSIVYKAYVRGYEETYRYAFVILKNKTEEYLEKYIIHAKNDRNEQ
ncbi:hypothetical protein [Pueribacillus sp. YX66]|uniref:hypothetical protein n=1 Tax=Pueribacillus sp. YX66 TaxID=3229242 RepID=UPI00358D7457